MRKLVLVHGRGQHDKDPKALKEAWIDALRNGLAGSGLDLPVAPQDIAFPYYGDVLNNLVEGEDEAITRGSSEDQQEIEFRQLLMEEMAEAAGITPDDILSASEDPTVSRDLFNAGWARAIMRAFDNHLPLVSGLAVARFTRDVWAYLKRPGVRDAVERLVLDKIADNECVVVGHSLGSIVAYGTVNRDDRLKAPVLITIGSPLGVGRIQDAIGVMRRPGCVKRWYNARDRRDFVALYLLKRPQFVINPEVDENYDKVNNFESNRHGIAGYLSDTHVAREIYNGLKA